MGMLYRRKKRDPATGLLVEQGPWWMKYYDGGKPIYESTGKDEKREGLVVLRRAETKVADGQREGPAVNRTRFEDLIEGLKNDYILKRLKTWKLREQHLSRLKPVFGGMRAKAITTPKLQAYVAKRLEEGAAPGTVNRELDCLHRMMILGQRHTPPKIIFIPHFPRLAEDNVREGFCEHDAYLCIRGAAPYHIQVAATIGYYTGMRKGEILSLQWEKHIDIEQHCIRLERKQTKTNTSRGLYMEGDFLKVMLKAKEVRDREYPTCPWVVHLKGQRVKSFDHGWTALMKRLSMPGVLFHDLRRTGVRNLVRAGVPETVAMKISGHKTRSVFDRYNITSEEDLKEAAIRLDDYIRGKKVTLPVTLDEAPGPHDADPDAQPIDNWRRGWGSNPRSRCQDSSFRDCPIRPLSHLSAW